MKMFAISTCEYISAEQSLVAVPPASAKLRWLRIDKLFPPVNLCSAMPEGDAVLSAREQTYYR